MTFVTFHEEAAAEVDEAARYYEDRAPGLGQSFIDEVDAAVDEVLENPEAFQRMGGEVRHKRVRRFPYGLLYVIEIDRIRVMAVAHQRRRPGYWRYRA